MDGGQQVPLAFSQTLTVFVLELVSAGYFGDDIGESFRREGRAMLDAVLADLGRLPEVRVETVINEPPLLQRIARSDADFTLVIAPEFDQLLEQFCAAARQSGAMSLNGDPAALLLGADKWEFAGHLLRHRLPSIPTQSLSLGEAPSEWPCVIKPRFGAGSWLVRRIESPADYAAAISDYRQAGLTELLCQPLIAGRSCSVAALVRPGTSPQILPVADQRLSADGQFRYLGGRVPAEVSPETFQCIQSLMNEVIGTIPGLKGYVSCDLVVSPGGEIRIVELNPRLTTSYLGYRKLCEDNLMERLLFPDRQNPPLRWKRGIVSFDADGVCRYAGGP